MVLIPCFRQKPAVWTVREVLTNYSSGFSTSSFSSRTAVNRDRCSAWLVARRAGPCAIQTCLHTEAHAGGAKLNFCLGTFMTIVFKTLSASVWRCASHRGNSHPM